MRNEDFKIFISTFGEATFTTDVPPSILDKYKNRLPDKLINYWKEEGWSAYANGLFWTVNPEKFEGVLTMWLEGTSISDIDAYHVFARTAFGELFVWGQRNNQYFTIACPFNEIYIDKNKLETPESHPDIAVGGFFTMSEKEDYDIEDVNGEFLFKQALERFGPLKEDEIYCFEPALTFGGSATLESINKADLQAHLAVLCQLAPVEILNSDTSGLV